MRREARFTWIIGILSIILLDIALNFLLLKQTLFTAWVVVPGALGLFLGLVWMIFSMARLFGAPVSGRFGAGASANAVLASVVVFLICIVIFAFARSTQASWDLTREGRQELAPQTVQILESLDKEVEVYGLFVSAADSEVAVSRDKTRRFLERCQALTGFLNVRFVDPERDPMILAQLGLRRVSTQGTVVVRCGSRTRVIPFQGVSPRLEERDFTNSLINVVRDAEPKVYFLQGHGEQDIGDPDPKIGFSGLQQLLQAESYVIERLTMTPAETAIPSDCSILVMLGQNKDLHPSEIQALQEYVQRGGRILTFFDFWIVDRPNGVAAHEQFRPWLERRCGVRVGDDVIFSREHLSEVWLVPDFGAAGGAERRGSYNDDHPITRSMAQNLQLRGGVRSVALTDPLPDGIVGEELLFSTPNTWAETNLDELRDPDNPRVNQDPDERAGPVPIAAAVTIPTETPIGDTGLTRDARIVVMGNLDMADNQHIVSTGNLIMNTFAWLSESEELIGMRAVGEENPPIMMTPLDEQIVAWLASLGLLHVVALAGIAVYFLRSKYQ